MLNRIRRWVAGDPIHRAARTAAQAFVALFTLQLVGWLQAVIDWTTTGGDFPDASVIGKAAIAGAASAGISLVTWIQNALEDRGTVPAPLKHQSIWGEAHQDPQNHNG